MTLTLWVPVLAFLVWATAVFHYLPVFRLDLDLGDQILSSFLFISYLILIRAWSYAGPMVAAILSALAALVVLYLCLALKEPALLLQVLAYGFLYLCLAVFLYEMQSKLSYSRIQRERNLEELVTLDQELTRKNELEKALERRIERFLDLHQFAETLKGVPTAPQLAHRVVNEARALVPKAEECVLYLVDEKNEKLSWAASSGSGVGLFKDDRGSAYEEWVMRRSRPLLIEDTRTDFRFYTEKNRTTGLLRSVCATPLVTENKVLGVLSAASSRENIFSSDDLHALDIISGLAAVTLRNRLLYDKTEELAIRDGLTGLYLKRYYLERLSEEVTRARRSGKNFSLILLDIDNFKHYNDEFGHSAGDLVLRNVASILMRCLEPAELGARYGGEEFAVLMPNKGPKEALETAEKIRAGVEENKLIIRRVQGTVTVSLGTASYPRHGTTAEALLRMADEGLYKAKNEGRNRVCGSI